jgi:hypothetical protein
MQNVDTRLTDLIPERRDHHDKPNEKSRSPRMELINNVREEPLILWPRQKQEGQKKRILQSIDSPPQICLCADVTKIGLSTPIVPMTGSYNVCDALALGDLLKRAKSGMFTARLEKRPMTTFRAWSAA